jgi:ABC-type uncharacterized transport system ATPase subunit
VIQFKGITRYCGVGSATVAANRDLNFTVRRGAIHAIIGENGAGKSTAMKILFGLMQPHAGEVLIDGKPVEMKSPRDAMELGIGMVHQHFMLAEPYSALDNILLHQKNTFFLDREGERKRLNELSKKFGLLVDLDKPVAELSVGLQQRVEILKILAQNSEIIILDEPTAVLTPQEVEALFENLLQLQKLGKTILIITHKLKEVMRWSNRVTVLRQGHAIAERDTAGTSVDELAELMIGHRPVVNVENRKAPVSGADDILKIKDVSARRETHTIENIQFDVRRGEILGIAGVEGNGQDVLIQSLLDPQSLAHLQGEIILKGQKTNKLSARKIREIGTGAFPEDRLRYGVLQRRPLYENFLLGFQNLREMRWGPFLRWNRIQEKTKKALQDYSVQPPAVDYIVDRLSGGNQQKLVVARELSQKPQFVLAAQPTRGVDIGAIEFIHGELRTLRDQGTGVLLISSELDELLALSDRILVLFKGRITAEFSRAQFDAFRIGAAMGGKSE